MRLVAEDTVENETTTDGEEHGSDDGHDPMHTFKVACPPEPEERDGQRERSHAGWRQLVLRDDVAIFVEPPGLVLVFPVEVGWDDNAEG